MKYLIFALSIAFTLVFTNAYASVDPATVITNFREVSPGLYRGARPSDEGLQALADVVFKTILTIDDATEANVHEAKVAAILGLIPVAVPMGSLIPPTGKKMAKIRAILLDPSNKPLFIHCKHGEDRTGLVIGLYRFQDQGWTAENAYKEMEQLGFHKILFGLYLYFKQKTGYDD